MNTPRSPLSERIRAIPRLDPSARAIEYEGEWHDWGAVAEAMETVAPIVTEPGRPIGILLRNRPALVGAVLGVVAEGGCVVTINPDRGVERTRADLAELDVEVFLGLEADVRRLLDSDSGTTRSVAMARLAKEPLLYFERRIDPPPHPRPATAVRMLTSGTTGTPKRIDLDFALFERVFRGAKHYESNKADDLRLRKGVAIIHAPLVHVSGIFRTLQCVVDGRSFCLLDRFEVGRWLEAVRSHQPRTASLVPAALRMVLAADIDPTALACLQSVVCGTAPLDPEDADAFFERFGVPVLVSYGATEFGGGVAGWNVKDHAQYARIKSGSVGRAHPGCSLRVVSESNGRPLGPNQAGLLEVKAAQLGGEDWTRTTDLARIDEDGFLWILGRADQAIIRGGFKVLPETVQAALERHPEVRGAAVIGRPDPRLGAVPVAAVELIEGSGLDEAALADHLGAQLSRYEIPVEIRIEARLPRTASGKVDLQSIRALFAEPLPSDAATHDTVRSGEGSA